MLKEAKIDGELMASLGNSIKNFEGAAKNMAPTVDALAGQKKYAEEMTAAADNMASLNSLYKAQLESASRNAEANKEIAENAAKLKEQMQSMTANIATLNSVYGGMLSAMSNRG
jgi:gliding motility-associated protein GldL